MQRATWVWTRPAPAELVSWSRHHDVGEVFLSVPWNVADSADLPWLRSAVRDLREAGIRASALGGDRGWVDRPKNALEWLAGAVATGLFEGVHLDIEAWTHPGWTTDRAAVVARYLDVVERVAKASPLPLEVDIAHWLHQVPTATSASLDLAVMRLARAVTVLSYRNTATGRDSITDIAATELGNAGRLGIPCRLGVETKYRGPRPVDRKQTFHGLGQAALSTALATVDSVESSHLAYAGTAVHHFQTWRDL